MVAVYDTATGEIRQVFPGATGITAQMESGTAWTRSSLC